MSTSRGVGAASTGQGPAPGGKGEGCVCRQREGSLSRCGTVRTERRHQVQKSAGVGKLGAGTGRRVQPSLGSSSPSSGRQVRSKPAARLPSCFQCSLGKLRAAQPLWCCVPLCASGMPAPRDAWGQSWGITSRAAEGGEQPEASSGSGPSTPAAGAHHGLWGPGSGVSRALCLSSSPLDGVWSRAARFLQKS